MKAAQAKVLDTVAFALIVILAVMLNCVAQLVVRLILYWRRILVFTLFAGAAAVVAIFLLPG